MSEFLRVFPDLGVELPYRAVVLGGASGIGAAVVHVLQHIGCQVVSVDRSHPDVRPNSVALGKPVELRYDLTQESQVQLLHEELVARFGAIDGLVHCVGVLEPIAKSTEVDLAAWQRVIDVNLMSVFLVTRHLGPLLFASRYAAFVTIGSAAGSVGVAPSPAYGPSKAAVSQFSKNLALEWASKGVRVNCVAPGFIDTPMLSHLTEHSRLNMRSLADRAPMRRCGQPLEIANTVAFLLSKYASFLTGTTIYVDGGWSAAGR